MHWDSDSGPRAWEVKEPLGGKEEKVTRNRCSSKPAVVRHAWSFLPSGKHWLGRDIAPQSTHRVVSAKGGSLEGRGKIRGGQWDMELEVPGSNPVFSYEVDNPGQDAWTFRAFISALIQ